jgi:hypothetical protein
MLEMWDVKAEVDHLQCIDEASEIEYHILPYLHRWFLLVVYLTKVSRPAFRADSGCCAVRVLNAVIDLGRMGPGEPVTLPLHRCRMMSWNCLVTERSAGTMEKNN